jgi:hypothetical protein
MPIDFPANPTNGQVYSNWIYDSSISAWRNVNTDTGVAALNTMGLRNVVPTSVSVTAGSAVANANGSVTFTNTPIVRLDGIFNSIYKSYRIVVTIDSSAANTELGGRLRTVAGDDTGTNYFQGGQRILFTGTTSNYSVGSGTLWYFNHISTDANRPTTYSLDLSYPNLPTGTVFSGSGFGNIGGTGPSGYIASGISLTTTQFTGFTLASLSSNNMTGTITVYGYTN